MRFRFLALVLLALALAVAPAGAHLRHQVYVTGSDVTDNDNTPASPTAVTGLIWPAHANIPVWFRCTMSVTTGDVSSELRFDITGPAGAETITAKSATATGLVMEMSTVTDVATLTAVGGQPVTRSVFTLEGVLKPTAEGDYQVRVEPEVDAQAATVEIGSVCEYSYENVTP